MRDYETDFVEDSLDQAILMHRDAHFAGSFEEMLKYYIAGGKGIDPQFDIERIQALALEEKSINRNLAAELLNAKEAEEVKRARDAYKAFRELYENSKSKNLLPILISNLILSEEILPENEIAAIVAHKSAAVPLLINLLRSEDMYNPLFPGYGQAPYLAAKCLGQIGDQRAIITLFETIGKGDFFDDDIALNALSAIGEPAKQFLLKIVNKLPLTEDNERAAIALLNFKEDEEIASVCFDFLKTLDLKKEASLATYLILACEALKDPKKRKEFVAFSNQVPKELQNDCKAIIKLWT